MKFNLSLVFLAAVVSGQVESQIDSNTSQKQKIKQRGVRNKSSKVAVAPIPDAPIADPVAPLTKMPDAPIAELGAPLTNRPDAPIAQPVAPEAEPVAPKAEPVEPRKFICGFDLLNRGTNSISHI